MRQLVSSIKYRWLSWVSAPYYLTAMNDPSDRSKQDRTEEFVTFFDLLVGDDVRPDVLQLAVDRNGVFTQGAKGAVPHTGFEEPVLQALCYLDAYSRHNDPFSSEEQWTMEQDVAEGGTDYGWPRFLLPNMGQIEKELRPVFVSINRLLNQKDLVPHVALAIAVENYGVWSRESSKQFVSHSADSKVSVQALTGLSIALLHKENPPPQDYLEWYDEEDPLNWLGWPADALPKFRNSSDSWLDVFHQLRARGAFFRHDLMTVGRLILTERASPGLVKTAVERFGVYGDDAHGRLTKYQDAHSEVRGLDHSLSELATRLRQGARLQDDLLSSDDFVKFGWPSDQMPDFEALRNDPIPEAPLPAGAVPKQTLEGQGAVVLPAWQQPPSDQEREAQLSDHDERAYLTVIAGLLWFIQGKITKNCHPDYRSQSKLIQTFERTLGKLHRAKERNIKDKFGRANKLTTLMEPPPDAATPAEAKDQEDEKGKT